MDGVTWRSPVAAAFAKTANLWTELAADGGGDYTVEECLTKAAEAHRMAEEVEARYIDAAPQEIYPDLRRMDYLINRLPMARLNYDRAMSRATRTTATLSAMPHGSGVSDPVASGYALVEVARERLTAILRELGLHRDALAPLIEKLDTQLERNVMTRRYIHGDSVVSIGIDLSYSKERVYQVIREATVKINASKLHALHTDP